MKRIRLAIIGAGNIAQSYHIPILNSQPTVEIISICDINKSLAKFVAQKYNINHYTDSVDEVLELEGIDAVDICTTTNSHSEIAIKCIYKGIPVFIEKPIATNLKEAEQIAKAADKYNTSVMIGMNTRFRSDTIMLKNYVRLDEIGEVFYIKTGWLQQKRDRAWLDQTEKSGGGVLFDLGISIIDALLWIYNFIPIKSVAAKNFRCVTKNVEDVSISTVKFNNGSIATIETSWSLFSTKSNYYCDVYGTKGSVRINPVQLYKRQEDIFVPVNQPYSANKMEIYKKSFENELKHFLNVVQGYSPVISTVSEAVQIMKIIDAMYRSAKKDKEITIK